MSTISVYAFLAEGSEDGEYESWTTTNRYEADDYAEKHGYAIFELEYEYSDSWLVADYRTKDPGQDDGLETHPGINA